MGKVVTVNYKILHYLLLKATLFFPSKFHLNSLLTLIKYKGNYILFL